MSTVRVSSQIAPEGREGWKAQAACLDVAPELVDPTFFPASSDPSAYDDAREICHACPVMQTCLAYTMATEPRNARHGMVGGLTPEQRIALYRRNTRVRDDSRPARTYTKGERLEAAAAKRARGLQLLAEGRTPEEVAVALDVKRPTVYLWRRRNRPGTETTT